jgi:mannose-1-phosphate guanylyltransferase
MRLNESNMIDHYYAVIMAGGGGTRLWPLSRQSRPKQMLELISSESLFRTAFCRLQGLFANENILVVTTQEQAGQLMEQCPEIPQENFLLEPQPRGTASVVGLAAIALQQRDPQAVMAVLTSDHHIANEEKFRQLLETAYGIARQAYLVTLGIAPTYPATGYGYIQSGSKLGTFNGSEAYEVKRFKEKPALEQAQEMLASGDHAWNSGMFVWQVKDILKEFERQMPALYGHLQNIARAWDTPQRSTVLQATWPLLEVITIDYGIMEGAEKVAVIPAAGLGWNDIGSWESIFDIFPQDENGNIAVNGEPIFLDTHNTLIYSLSPERLAVTIGLEDLVVVDTGDVLLICTREQAQNVRQVVSQLKQTNPKYL